jgi:hypothetical protein
MMRLRTSSLLVTLCLFVAVALAGCLTAEPAPPDLSAAAIGPPPGDYKTQIPEYFKPSLLDPYSAVYQFREPVRGWERGNDGIMKVFWAVCGTLYAKNRFGGYADPSPFLTIFSQERIVGLVGESSVVSRRCTAWYGAEGARQ